MARARTLDGPYELHPDVYVLSARHRPDVALQRAGHADLVDTPDGSTYMVHLCGRPLPNRGRCTLGRETAIQKMVRGSDGWLRAVDGNGIPSIDVEAPDVATQVVSDSPARENFDGAQLPIEFQWLRSPWPDELFSLTERPGYLRLHGRETVGSLFKQALVARRQQSHCYSASAIVEFEPRHFQQMAGLICYYNSSKFHYLYISIDDDARKHVRVMSALPDQPQTDAFTPPFPIPSNLPVELCVEVDYDRLHFGYRVDGDEWTWIPQQFDASILSDEATAPGLPNFTGAFVGMACQDMSGARCPADFDWFEYVERSYRRDPFHE
jgi:xylan 1,4-beta-xylosidase